MPSNHISNKEYNDYVEAGGLTKSSSRHPDAMEHLIDVIHQCHRDYVLGKALHQVPLRIMDALLDAEKLCDDQREDPEKIFKELLERIKQKYAEQEVL
jgi:hypothetical protein